MIQQRKWILDHKIPLALIFTLLIQAGTAVWWAANKESQDQFRDQRLQEIKTTLDKKDEHTLIVLQRLSRLEAFAEMHSDILRRIEANVTLKNK
jgi:plastocyanin domain-containing protein